MDCWTYSLSTLAASPTFLSEFLMAIVACGINIKRKGQIGHVMPADYSLVGKYLQNFFSIPVSIKFLFHRFLTSVVVRHPTSTSLGSDSYSQSCISPGRVSESYIGTHVTWVSFSSHAVALLALLPLTTFFFSDSLILSIQTHVSGRLLSKKCL